MQLKSRLDSQRSDASEAEDEDLVAEHDDAADSPRAQSPSPSSQEQTRSQQSSNKGKAAIVGGKKVPAKSTTRSSTSNQPTLALNDTAEVVRIINSLETQQQRSNQMQGHITGLLSRDQTSATTNWGAWIGSMSGQFEPHLLPRFFKQSFDLVQGFAEESRLARQPNLHQQTTPYSSRVRPTPLSSPSSLVHNSSRSNKKRHSSSSSSSSSKPSSPRVTEHRARGTPCHQLLVRTFQLRLPNHQDQSVLRQTEGRGTRSGLVLARPSHRLRNHLDRLVLRTLAPPSCPTSRTSAYRRLLQSSSSTHHTHPSDM